MYKVAVLDTNKNVLEPCHPAVARRLLRRGDAAVWQRAPFTIILKREVPQDEIVTGDYTLSWDPGSRTSGVSITEASGGIVFAAELHHRGYKIKRWLKDRAGFRRGRRTRNLRYRPARWANRARKVPVLVDGRWTYQSADEPAGSDASKTLNKFRRVSWAQLRDPRYNWTRLKTGWKRTRIVHQKRAKNGWVAPSLMSRVFNIETWTRRLRKVYPITQLAIEDVKFDMQLMENPSIHGVEYQRGTLHGYEVREYLLELTGRKCAYCGAKDVRLEIEHIVPKSKGGTNRPANLTMACRPCNQNKANHYGDALVAACGEDFAKRVAGALRKSTKGLKDAAAVNTIRWKLRETLEATGLPVITGSGGRTAYNRNVAGLPKTHYYDAASVMDAPKRPNAPLPVLVIAAVGYGRRDNVGYKFSMTAPGFRLPSQKRKESGGFQKYDHVTLTRRDGSRVDGVVNCFDKTAKGKPRRLRVEYFDPDTADPRVGGNVDQLTLRRRRDGYHYGSVLARMEFHDAPIVPEVPKPKRTPRPANPQMLMDIAEEPRTSRTPKQRVQRTRRLRKNESAPEQITMFE